MCQQDLPTTVTVVLSLTPWAAQQQQIDSMLLVVTPLKVTVFAILGNDVFALKVLFENQLARNFYLGATKSSSLVDVPTKVAGCLFSKKFKRKSGRWQWHPLGRHSLCLSTKTEIIGAGNLLKRLLFWRHFFYFKSWHIQG